MYAFESKDIKNCVLAFTRIGLTWYWEISTSLIHIDQLSLIFQYFATVGKASACPSQVITMLSQTLIQEIKYQDY
jgi:hypothetical protein